MKNYLLSAALCGSLLFSGSAMAEVEHYKFDTVHSQVIFFVEHMGFAKSEGEFLDFDGDLYIDRDNLANSSVNVVVKTASVDMDDTKWDDHLKNADFFNVTEFPVMTFKSKEVVLTGENSADIHGDLTILGITKPLVLHTVHNKTGENPYSKKKQVGFSATGVVKRSEYGMDYGIPNVGDEAELRIEVEAVKQ